MISIKKAKFSEGLYRNIEGYTIAVQGYKLSTIYIVIENYK